MNNFLRKDAVLSVFVLLVFAGLIAAIGNAPTQGGNLDNWGTALNSWVGTSINATGGFLNTLSVNSSDIVGASVINSSHIVDGANGVQAADIAAGAVNGSILAMQSINFTHITPGAVIGAHIGIQTINHSQLNLTNAGFGNVINSTHIVNGANGVQADDIAPLSINFTHLVSGQLINSTHIGPNMVNATHLLGQSINFSHLNLTNAGFGNVINSTHIVNGINGVQVDDLSASIGINATHFAGQSINSSHLNLTNAGFGNVINSTHIVNGDAGVTLADMAANSVNSTHIVDAFIVAADIPASTINASHIVMQGINATHIVYGAVNGSHIAQQTVNSTHILPGVINASHITFWAINASHINFNVINASHIVFGSVNGSHLAQQSVNDTHILPGRINASHIALVGLTNISSINITSNLTITNGTNVTPFQVITPGSALGNSTNTINRIKIVVNVTSAGNATTVTDSDVQSRSIILITPGSNGTAFTGICGIQSITSGTSFIVNCVPNPPAGITPVNFMFNYMLITPP